MIRPCLRCRASVSILYDSEANVILDFMANVVRIGPSRGKGRRNFNAER